MYAGKTSTLIKLSKQPNSVIFDYDTEHRNQPYGGTLHNHNDISVDCIKLNELYLPLEQNIFINEAQFFKSLIPFVKNALDQQKHIYIFGLDGDFKQEKFGDILDLIPLCDTIVKLHAICKCGKNAIFSKRLSTSQHQYGPSDTYIPVCRNCI
jgi:thymidine kinase